MNKPAEQSRTKNFEEEMLPHMSHLQNYALKMTGNYDDAKDLVQETYLKAYRFFDSYEMGTNSKAWLFRIMKNSFINQYRKNVSEPQKVAYDEVEEFIDLIKDDMMEPNNLEKKYFDSLLGDEISEALKSIPEEFRRIVILCDMENWTYEEISNHLNIPIGTVRSRLHRGRKMLEEKLSDYAASYGYMSKN
jgi:RNA polymerase sigma-70 factor, ECF subfamily